MATKNQIKTGSLRSFLNSKQLLILTIALGVSTASAAPIVGTFNMTGSVTVSAATIDWSSNGGTTGTFITNSPSTGFFTGLFGGNPPVYFGTVKDLSVAPPVGRFLDSFTAPTFGGLYFDLTNIIAPTAPACSFVINPGLDVACSLGSFTLKNTLSGVAIDFGVLGFFQNGVDLTTRSIGLGSYSTQLVGSNVLAVATTIAGGGNVATSYSANYSAGVPEPSSLALFCIGGGLIGAISAYRSRRS